MLKIHEAAYVIPFRGRAFINPPHPKPPPPADARKAPLNPNAGAAVNRAEPAF
jgi:hypothetical protein